MKIHKAFSALSPLWQMIFAVIIIGIIASFEVKTTSTSQEISVGVMTGEVFSILFVAFFVAMIAGQIAISRYNKTRPKGAKKLSLLTMHPPELLESDERLGQTTAKATRNVYVYNNYAIPLLVMGMLFFHFNTAIMGVISIVYVIGYYGTYLYTIWPVLKES